MKRFICPFLDLMIISLITLPVIFYLQKINHPYLALAKAIPFALFLNKDFFSNRSLGKRIFNYLIVDNKYHTNVSTLKCLIRNLTLFIYPIEAIVMVFNSERRIGDRLTGTKLVDSNINKIEYERKPEKISSILMTFLLTVLILFVLGSFLDW